MELRMKTITLLMSLLFLFVACQKGHDFAEKKTFVVTDQMKQEMLAAELEKNRIQTCDPPEEKVGFFKRIKNKILDIFFKKKRKRFDLTYPQVITDRVLKELKEHIFETQGFMPEKFWLALKPETKTRIDSYLINNFYMFSDEEFQELRNVVAFSFLFYFQAEDRQPGYEIHLDREDLPKNKINIAYTEDAKFEERKKISICDQGKLLDIAFQEDGSHYVPSNLKGRLRCEKDGHKVNMDWVEKDDRSTIFLTLWSQGVTALPVRLALPKGDLGVDTSSRRPELSGFANGTDVKMVVSTKKKGSLIRRIISVDALTQDGIKINMPKLKCKDPIPFPLQ